MGPETLQRDRLTDGDWQTLIVLDALRYDVAADIMPEIGLPPPELVDSEAYNTASWYLAHWRQIADCVLVSANPIPFGRQTNAITAEFAEAIQAWDGTRIEPNRTLCAFLEARMRKPDARVVVHFLPPHLPFITERGRALVEEAFRHPLPASNLANIYHVAMQHGRRYGWDELLACYRDAARQMIQFVLDHRQAFGERVVLTSDHGELMGERERYGHRWRCEQETLCQVPWLELP